MECVVWTLYDDFLWQHDALATQVKQNLRGGDFCTDIVSHQALPQGYVKGCWKNCQEPTTEFPQFWVLPTPQL